MGDVHQLSDYDPGGCGEGLAVLWIDADADSQNWLSHLKLST